MFNQLKRLALKNRRPRAHSLIEVSLLSVLFVVIAILCLDVGYVMMGSQLNDRACRDAARAAAEADNYLGSLQMAQAAVNRDNCQIGRAHV